MFSHKPAIVIVLRLKSIEFYNGKESEKEILQFPPKVLKKDEIVDWEKFELFIEEFIARNSLRKQHAIMVLGKDILFEKTIPLGDPEKEKSDTAKFFKSIPYDEKDIITKKLRDEDKIYLVSTHKDFYQSVKYTLEKFGWTIEQVVPMTMFEDFDDDRTLDYAEVNQILSHTDLLKIGDMTSDEETIRPSRAAQVEEAKNNGMFSKANIILLVIIAFLCGAIVFGLLYFDVVKMPMGSQVVPTPTSAPTAAPTPVSSFNKSEASVKVLNGTGTPGQAGKVQTMMEEAGFSDISTDNAEDKGTITKVVFSSSIPQEIRDEVVELLEEIFENVSESLDEEASDDITITTGSEK